MSCVNPRPYFVSAFGGSPKPLMEDLPSGSVGAHGRIVYLPCGQCMECRLSKRRDFTVLQVLEASLHPYNWFLTLTYDDAHLPKNGSLVKSHLSSFLEIMRHYCSRCSSAFRYFGCGEYGEKYHRPHYHLSLFGLAPSVLGIDLQEDIDIRRYLNDGCLLRLSHASTDSNGNPFWHSKVVANYWPYGSHKIYFANINTFQYVAGYVTKKLSGKERIDFEKSSGCINTFSVQSRPSVGFPWYKKYCGNLMQEFNGKLYHDFISTADFDWRVPRIMMKWHERRLNNPLAFRRIGLLRSLNSPDVPDREQLLRLKISDEHKARRFKINNLHKEL